MSKQYDDYLEAHIAAVGNAAWWMVTKLDVVKELTKDEVNSFLANVNRHDESKLDIEEYEPYDEYFYGTKDGDLFNSAWLHHIHNNPHHWQHWLLVNDDGKCGDRGKIVALEMPRTYALEMVADWWSFSWRSGNLAEVFDWYERHKDGIVLHPDTREYVERILGEIREAIGKGQS